MIWNFKDLKDFNGRTYGDKVLLDETFSIAKDLQYVGYQRGLALMV